MKQINSTMSEAKRRAYINLKLALLGLPHEADAEFEEMMAALLPRQQETARLLTDYISPSGQRIQDFFDDYLRGTGVTVRLMRRSFVLDRYGLARTLSFPPDKDEYASEYGQSYRARNGVLHNPKSDRRTTAGIFHVAEGGLPIPNDKIAVPKPVFGEMLRRALNPPRELMRLPFSPPAECFVSLLLRPVVCPAVPGFTEEKTMEVRFFAPGSLVSNLDFVESIFGNAGDPFLPENDAALDVEHWTGHTGCVILAPHLTKVTKKEAGLEGDGLYNDGRAFKLTARDARGVMVTIIADNYFGYCKKEVKTQISFSANLFGLAEEEHAGGALAFPSYDLGEEFSGYLHVPKLMHNFKEASQMFASIMDVKPEGYAVDKRFPDIVYVPEDVHFDLLRQTVSWPGHSIKLLPTKIYVRPSGYRVRMEKPPGGRSWRLIGDVAEPTLCHKPCTVSGGGKSEISKPISDAIIHGPVFIADFKREFDYVGKLIRHDYGQRFRDKSLWRENSRPLLSSERSLGSVIKLLTPSDEYTDEYNAWLANIPQYIKELVYVVKRYYKPEMGDSWQEHFSVDIINGRPGNELKFDGRKLVANYMRVGYDTDGLWRTFGLRKDFHPATKLQAEDDITASVVVPAAALQHLNPDYKNASVKFIHNCEYRLFQRPDDAIHRGYDKLTEAEFTRADNFFSNYEPLTLNDARELLDDSIGFDKFTLPMQQFIREFDGKPSYFVCTANPRLVDGKPTKNPRYLQTRPDLLDERSKYLAEICTRLWRQLPPDRPLHMPVNAVLPGRRNNPPEGKVRSLAVFNPIHYMELPELFMEFICSMTGKSPSTTGAGSEGALTKGPFNALPPIIDLNNALVSYLLTGDHVFITAAGYVGPQCRVDHDISLLMPEIWCRMSVEERDPAFLIERGYLERCRDFTQAGQKVLASRLGYRVTLRFVNAFFGRVFSHPHQVFTEKMLKPETQDFDIFADGMENIIETHRHVAKAYFADGSIEQACPPLKALLQIMRDDGSIDDPAFRAMFTREHLLASDWYAKRLTAKQKIDTQLWERHVGYLKSFLGRTGYAQEARRLDIEARLQRAHQQLDFVSSPEYLKHLTGTIGA